MNKQNFLWFLKLALILWAGVFLRTYLAFNMPLNHDTRIWDTLKDAWAMGQSPYSTQFHYIYAVPWFYVISLTSFLAGMADFPFVIAIKFPLILADMGLFFLLIASCRRLEMSREKALFCAACFFLNPISLMTTGVHGQFDNISLLFLLLAWFAFSFKSKNPLIWGCLFLSLSVWVKHFTAMIAFVMAFSRKKMTQRTSVILTAPVIFAASFLFYWKDFQIINKYVVQYNLNGGYWGWSGVICRSLLFFTGYDLIQHPLFYYIKYFNGLLYVAIIGASWWVVKRYSLLDSILIIFLIFYTFTTQIGVQYTLWLLPFAVLKPNRYLLAYTITGAVQLAAFYYCHYHWWLKIPIEGTLQNLIPETYVLFRYLTWVVCALWLFHYLRVGRRAAQTV